MNDKKYIIFVVALLASRCMSYNDDHGPFPDAAKVERIKLSALICESGEANTKYDSTYSFLVLGQRESRLSLVWQNDTRFAKLAIRGKTVLQPTAFSTFNFTAGLFVFSADLNQDGADDFIIYSYSGGCGLACGYCNVTFILSAGEEYTLTTVMTLFPDENDFILVNKKPYFVHTSFHDVNRCNDGKNHNFWIYNLLAINKDEITVDNSVHPEFPKIIWYTFKPNHRETSIITDEQKRQLRKSAMLDIYWRG